MVTPWTSVRDRWWRDSFNYQQSRARINIECAFGMLTKRFLVLTRPMHMDMDKCKVTVRVAMKLHNLNIDRRGRATLDHGVVDTDFTGGYETAWAERRAAAIAVRRAAAGESTEGRQAASLALHLTSGSRDYLTNAVTSESPLPVWEEIDVPEDLVPNRVDLEGGPRAGLTDQLHSAYVRRPDPRAHAARIDAARFGS